MLALFVSLALLGLSAVDPVGIGAMPILLSQKEPYRRSFIFLGGSFVSLMVAGAMFAKGFGTALLHFEQAHTWIVPAVEAGAGIVLIGTAGYWLWRQKAGNLSVEPPHNVVTWLQLDNTKLFAFGALLVVVQSVVDVVFVVAMVHIGQLHLPDIASLAAVAIYAVAALVIQLAVVLAYRLSPPKGRDALLQKIHSLLGTYATQAVIGVSLLLGCVLLGMAVLT